jgi:ABC-type antimicrobial peptide transport system permease subunit
MALGADQRSVLRLIVFEGLTVGAAGIAVGIGGAALSSRVLTSIIYGVSPFDPATYVVVAAVLTGIAAISCAIPAMRASRVDPITALRLE